jgi:hypothetical protein
MSFSFNPSPASARAFRSVFTDDPMIRRSADGFGSQLHMHTDGTGNCINAAHIKTNAGHRTSLSNYEAAMSDLSADGLGMRRQTRGI